MRIKEKNRQAFSLLAVSIFVLSMIYMGTAVASTEAKSNPASRPYDYSQVSQSENNGTYADWYQDSGSYADEWSWDSRNWLFGPKPTFVIFHENGSPFTSDSYAAIGELLTIQVTVPRSVFIEGAVLGRVQVYGHYLTSNYNFSASFNLFFDGGPYAYERWFGSSNTYNMSEPLTPPVQGFLDIDTALCTNMTTTNEYVVNFRVSFGAGTPLGLYQLDMSVVDSHYNYIGSYNYGSGWQFRGIAVGIDPDDAWSFSYNGLYTLQKLDMDGDTLYSVSRTKDFIMRFNLSGEDPAWVELSFRMPTNIETLVNNTGWHREIVVSTGGWLYDEDLDTYVWNATIEVAQYVDVFGPYQAKQWVSVGTVEELNITVLNQVWNETISAYEYVVQEQTYWSDRYLMLIYNQSTSLFETRYGYRYWGYPYEEYIPGTYNQEITVYEPLPPDAPVFYELNDTYCAARQIDKEFVVDFVGHFTEAIPPTNQYSYLYFNDRAVAVDGSNYYPDTYGDYARQTNAEYEMARQIAIETPVTIARLLEADGTEPRGWMFQADQGEDFKIRGRLQGGASEASDVDGAAVTLEASDGFWSEEESWWSHLTYEIVVDTSGTPTLQAFNYTQKYNYTYGAFMDYVYTNITGWHNEYNDLTNNWEWVYGEYWEWCYMEVEGWHWQTWYLNQMTGEWQTESLQYRSAETLISSSFCTVSAFEKWVDGGDLYTSFLVNMSESVPSTSYYWTFSFMNNTWFEDYSSPYGEHQILTWEKEWVYSFTMAEKVYMEEIEYNQLAFTNAALSPDYLLGDERPYIEIDSEMVPVKVIENYDPWSGMTYANMFFYDHYDPAAGADVYYYRLENDTRVYVTYRTVKYIYNVTFADGSSILTTQQYAQYWYDGSTSVYWWMALDGSTYGGDYYTYPYYESPQSVVKYDVVEYSPYGEKMFIRYGSAGFLNISNWWWESLDNCYYFTDLDGNLYQVIYNTVTYNYEAYIAGSWYVVNYPFYYFEGEYLGDDVFLVGWESHRFWYTVKDDVEYEMPYPGAYAEDQWQLNNVESDGGKVPTTKSVFHGAFLYPVYTVSEDYFVRINGTEYLLMETTAMHSRAGGTDIWEMAQVGFSGEVGTFDANLMFSAADTFDYYTLYGGNMPDWDDTYHYYYISLFDGTRIVVNDTTIMQLFELEFEGKPFISARYHPEYMYSGNYSWYQYTAINGSVYILDEYVYLPVTATYIVDVWHYFNGTQWVDEYDFDGGTYNPYETGWGPAFYEVYKVHNSSYAGLYLNMRTSGRPIYEFVYESTTVTARAALENVNRMRFRWGYDVVYGLKPIESAVYRNFNTLVIGTPEWGMWGLKNWASNPDNGALDLDGDLDTADDQYFVLQEYSSTNSWNQTWDYMSVHLLWDPNATQYGDEINVWSHLGMYTNTWSYEWNQTFFWFHASDFSELDSAEMQAVQDIILAPEGDPMPGYWDIAWMAKNVTWADIVAEALANGWDWITSNEQSWTWLTFSIDQNYGTSYEEADVEHWLSINLHYEYSGLMIWEDENDDGLMMVDLSNPASGELTHYLIPDSVDDAVFVTPGMAYGDASASGNIRVELVDEITWGVAFINVNGTVYPFTLGGYWGWYDNMMTGSDLRTFDERPTKISIDEVSFLVHFQGHINATSLNNYANIKVDNFIGNWDVDMLGGRSNLENRSLALNYFASVQMSDFAFKANGTFAGGETTVGADTFQLETSNARFAEMIMGGVTYDWAKNTTAPYDVVCYTTPAGTFRMAFESDNGVSATAWSFATSMYYVSIGFPSWEGYAVYQDPVFVSYVSSRGTTSTPGQVTFSSFGISPTVPMETDSVTVGVDITALEPINNVQLVYWTESTSESYADMYWVSGARYQGTIPAFALDTQVYYKIVVQTSSGTYESGIQSYIVGTGVVTSTTGPTTGGPGTGALPLEMLVLIGGVAGVVVILLVLMARRRK